MCIRDRDTQKDHTPGANGYCQNCGVALAASVTTGEGTKVYVDFLEAFNQANTNGGTLTLLKDVTTTQTLNCYHEFTLDLNGFTLECTTTPAIYISSSANLTIQDSSNGRGGIKVSNWSIVVINYGTLSISGGNLEGWTAVSNQRYGKVTISGGHFKALYWNKNNDSYCIRNRSSSADDVVTITGGTFERENYDNVFDFALETPGTIQVKVGTFVNGVKVENGTPNSVLAKGYAFYENKENGDVLDGSDVITVDAVVKEHDHDLSYTYVPGYDKHRVSCPCGYRDEIKHAFDEDQTVCPCGYTWYSVGGNKTFIDCTILTEAYLKEIDNTLDDAMYLHGEKYVVQGTVNVEKPIVFMGDTLLVLADGCELKANYGIQALGTLNIYGQTLPQVSGWDLADRKAGILDASTASDVSNPETAIAGNVNIYGGAVFARGTGGGIGGKFGYDNTAPVSIAIYDGYVLSLIHI